MEGRRNEREGRFGVGALGGRWGGRWGWKREEEWEGEEAIGAGVEVEGAGVLGRVLRNGRMGGGDVIEGMG